MNMENQQPNMSSEFTLQNMVSILQKEVEEQKKKIAALMGTGNVQIDTNDVTILYHLQLRENQSLQTEIERLQQLLSEVDE